TQTIMVRHWPADQIGSFSWSGLSIKEARDPIRLDCVPGSNAGAANQGTMRSEDPALVGNKEPSCDARPHYPDLPESPLPEKQQCIMIGSKKMAQLHTPAEAAEI